jgi:hypothetical protein
MQKLFQSIYRLLVVVLVLVGMLGCDDDNPTFPKDRTVLRTGTTTGGRTFSVIQETISEGQDVILVSIEDEEDVILEEIRDRPQIVTDSVQVEELAGTPDLVYIKWQDNYYSLYTSAAYHYVIFPKGQATKILFSQVCLFDFYGHYLFQWIKGEYQLEYSGSTLSIVEHWKRCDESSGSCQLKETQLSRSYLVNALSVSLLTCEERSRTADYATTCLGQPQDLTPLPGEWQLTSMSPDDITKKCAAVAHTY